MSERISRRDFLLHGFNYIEKERNGVVSSKIKEILGIEMNLRFRFGNHYLSDEDAKTVENEEIQMILGEQTVLGVINAFNVDQSDVKGRTLVEILTATGVGGSRKEQLENYRVVKELLSRGVVFVSTDGEVSFIELEKRAKVLPDALVLAGLLLTSWSGVGVGVVTNEKINERLEQKEILGRMTRRDFLKFMLLGGGAAFLYGAPIWGVVNFAETRSLIEEITSDPEFVPLYDGLVQLRNKVMALNTWKVLESTKGEDLKRVLFYAGGGHRGARAEFLKGPEILAIEVERYAGLLSNEVLELLFDQGHSSPEILKVLKIYGEYFTQPEQIGKKVFETQVVENRVKSCLEILLRTVVVKISELEKKGEIEKMKVLTQMMVDLMMDHALLVDETRLLLDSDL